MRIFAALLPPADAFDDLDRFLGPRRPAASVSTTPFRWTPRDQWHLTLAFMADVEEWRIDGLLDGLADVAARRTPFPLVLEGGGAFPDAVRAKVLWCGVGGDTEVLVRLAASARNVANAVGTVPEGGRFRPHLTLGRLARPGEVSNWVRLLDAYAGPRWQADALTVIASHLGEGPRRRPRHEVLAELPFAETPA